MSIDRLIGEWNQELNEPIKLHTVNGNNEISHIPDDRSSKLQHPLVFCWISHSPMPSSSFQTSCKRDISTMGGSYYTMKRKF